MDLIIPDWQVPARVRACVSTRAGGVSEGVYGELNLGDHVGDEPAAVAENRRRLLAELGLQRPAQWLRQVHGTEVVEARDDGLVREADACWSDRPGQACIVMTADCLPTFFSDGERVAVAHAGWRGLVAGVLERTLDIFADPCRVHCWLGPAIGPTAFEVGDEVRAQFCAVSAAAADAFVPRDGHPGKWFADLYRLARQRLDAAGVASVSGGEYCTFSDPGRFYSYRRDGETGRMASVIWLE